MTPSKPVRLDKAVKALLKRSKGDWVRVANASGVSYSWISKFMNGHVANPGLETLLAVKKVLE